MTRFPQCRVPYDLSWEKWKLLDFLKNAGNRLKCPKCWNLNFISRKGACQLKNIANIFVLQNFRKCSTAFFGNCWKLLETYVDDPKQHNINNNVFIKILLQENSSKCLWRTKSLSVENTTMYIATYTSK